MRDIDLSYHDNFLDNFERTQKFVSLVSFKNKAKEEFFSIICQYFPDYYQEIELATKLE